MSDDQAMAARLAADSREQAPAAMAAASAAPAADEEIPDNFEDEAPQLCQAPPASSDEAAEKAAGGTWE